jgi:hypothetical protein
LAGVERSAIGVVVVDPGKNVGGLADAVAISERGNVEIVPCLAAAHDQERLDP